MKKISIIAVIALLAFASCDKTENVTPINDNTIVCLPEGDNSKYAFNGRSATYVFSPGDSIQVGDMRLHLTLMTQTMASIPLHPVMSASNTIYPADYVDHVDNGIPHFIVPQRMIFAKYGAWDRNLYYPHRYNYSSNGYVYITPFMQIADYNVQLTKRYASSIGIKTITIDSIELISNRTITGMAHLGTSGSTVFDSGSDRLILVPHDSQSATAMLERQEAILGYAYFPGFATMRVHWHGRGVSGVKYLSYNSSMIGNTNGNMMRLTVNITL